MTPHRVDGDGTVVVALFPEREAREIAQRLSPHGTVFEGSRVELVQEVARGCAALVVLPATGADGLPALPLVAQLRHQVPSVDVVAMTTAASTGRDLAALRLTSVTVAADIEQLQATMHRLGVHGATHAAPAYRLRRGVDLVPDDLLRDLLWQVANDPGGIRTGRDLADVAGVKYRTLCRWAADGGWPAPHGIIRAGRLLRFAAEAPGAGRRAAAGFATARALRAAIAQQLGAGADEGAVTVERVVATILPAIRPRTTREPW